MIEFLQFSAAGPREALGIAMDVAIKATLLIALALIAHQVLRRRFVLAASAVWNACLVSLLLLPLAVNAFPSLRIDCLPSRSVPMATTAPPIAREPAPQVEVMDPGAPSSAGPIEPTPFAAEVDTKLAAPPRSAEDRLFQGMAALYVLGVALLLVRLIRSLRAVGRLRRQGQDVESAAWTNRLEHWRFQLGLRQGIRLRSSSQIGVPVVVGWWQPMILIPEPMTADNDRGRIDAVLLHELAHVRRNDYFWNVLTRIVEAMYWIHPLVWLVRSALNNLREQACDDFCIRLLGGFQAYRAALLDVAVSVLERGAPGPALGLAMARSSKLASRIDRIGRSPGSTRCVLGRASRCGIGGTMLVAAAVIGMVRLAPVVAAQAPEPPKVAEEPTPNPDPLQDPKPDEARPQAPGDSEPKPQAEVKLVVETIKPVRLTTVLGTGVVKPFEPIAISAPVAGFIAKREVNEGDLVKKNQLLAILSAPDLRAQLEVKRAALIRVQAQLEQAKFAVTSAEAALAGANAKLEEAKADLAAAQNEMEYRTKQYNRIETLLKRGSIEQSLADEERSRLETAQANLKAAVARERSARALPDQASADVGGAQAARRVAMAQVAVAQSEVRQLEEALSSATIASPIDGIVMEMHADVGAPVRPEAPNPLFVLAPANKVTLTVNLGDRDAALVKRGSRAVCRFDALPDETFEGTVIRKAWSLDERTHTLPISIDLNNRENRLHPGMLGTVTIDRDPADAVLLVPLSACIPVQEAHNESSWYCYRVIDGEAQKTRIRVSRENFGMQTGGQFVTAKQVLRGLKGDEELVADARKVPADGVKVITKPITWEIMPPDLR